MPDSPAVTALAVGAFARREVAFDDGQRCELSQRETELLRYLACNGGRAVSRDEILSRVWGIRVRPCRTGRPS